MTPSDTRRRATVVLVLAFVALAMLSAKAGAAKGTYTQMLCANPDTRAGVGAEGQLPSGLTNQWVGNIVLSTAEQLTSCGRGPMNGSRGVPVVSGDNYQTNVPGQGVGALVYTPAADTTVVFDDLYFAANLTSLDYHEAVTLHGGAWDAVYAQPALITCDWSPANHCVASGTLTDPFSTANEHTWANPPANGFAFTVGCDIPGGGGWFCTAANQIFRFYGGKVVLRDESNPLGGAPPTGGITTDSPLTGAEDVTVSGTDVGSGLYRVLLLVDNHVTSAQLIDSNGGACADVNAQNDDPYEFAANRPCKLSAGGTFMFDTNALPQGKHDVKIQLEDAAGNATTVVDRNVTIGAAAPPGTATPQSVTTPVTTPAAPSVPVAPAPVATSPVATTPGAAPRPKAPKLVNGFHGGPSAVLSTTGATVVHVAHGASVLLTGRLVSRSGLPVSGAKIDVLRGVAGARGKLIGDQRVTTGFDGSFRYISAPGASRIVRFGYRASLRNKRFVGTAEIRIHVRAALTLRLSTAHLHNGQTLIYTGALLGPDAGGHFVDIEVHNGRRWQVICALRTAHDGAFTCAHHFTRTFTATSYAFRAVIHGQYGLPYDPARSVTRKVHVTP